MFSTFDRFTRFLRDRRATALVEFAWLWPIVALMMYGAYNLSLASNAGRQLSRLSNDIAQMIVTQPASGSKWCAAALPTTCAALEDYNLWYAHDSAVVEFPQVLRDSRADWASDIGISMTGVAFAPKSASCIGSSSASCYAAFVAWYAQNGAGAATRTCATGLSSAGSDTAPPSPTTLPDDLFFPVPIPSGTTGNPSTYGPPLFQIVVDVTYAWKPSGWRSTLGWFPTLNFAKSSYLSPRYVSQIVYKGGGAYGQACPQPAGWPTGSGAPVWPS